jgi:hypothetical protein
LLDRKGSNKKSKRDEPVYLLAEKIQAVKKLAASVRRVSALYDPKTAG